MTSRGLVVREQSREGLSFGKVTQALRAAFGGARSACAIVDQFTDIDIGILEELVSRRRGARVTIRGLILDLDGTLAPAYCEIPDHNLTHLDKLSSAGVRLVVYSNAVSTISPPRLAALQARNIPFFTGNIAKPNPHGFRAVCEEHGLEPHSTWMVGDDPTTDGGALNMHPDGEKVLGGMIFVRPIPDRPGTIKGIKRVTLGAKTIFRSFGLFATTVSNPRIITTRDIQAKTPTARDKSNY